MALLFAAGFTAVAAGGAGASSALGSMLGPRPAVASADLMRDGIAAFRNKDYEKARTIFRRLACRGNATAETLLGTMALNGQGGPRDEAIAAAWFLRAARRGHVPAQLALADSFARGRGVPKDLDRARALAQAAAVQGDPAAGNLAERLAAAN